MDETLQELENELKRLTPRRPSAALIKALEGELGLPVASASARRDNAAAGVRPWKWASWSLAAAAVIAFVALFQFARQPAAPSAQPAVEVAVAPTVKPVRSDTTPGNRYEPVQATTVLYDLKEDGTAVLADRTEGRQVRYRYVDTYTWKNPTTNASLRWSVPRDEVRVIRASLD